MAEDHDRNPALYGRCGRPWYRLAPRSAAPATIIQAWPTNLSAREPDRLCLAPPVLGTASRGSVRGRIRQLISSSVSAGISRSPVQKLGRATGAQQGRALEPGRGRHAASPWQIPWRGWKDILWRTYERIGEDRLLAVAAGVVFYGLLALFPAITAMVSLYGLFAKASTINEHFSAAAGLLPEGG